MGLVEANRRGGTSSPSTPEDRKQGENALSRSGAKLLPLEGRTKGRVKTCPWARKTLPQPNLLLWPGSALLQT
jgi:hypothetical protein